MLEHGGRFCHITQHETQKSEACRLTDTWTEKSTYQGFILSFTRFHLIIDHQVWGNYMRLVKELYPTQPKGKCLILLAYCNGKYLWPPVTDIRDKSTGWAKVLEEARVMLPDLISNVLKNKVHIKINFTHCSK